MSEKVAEEEDSNLTSGQVQTIMDRLLYKSLEPVILYTNLFDTQLVYLLGLVTRNKKRKISPLDRDVITTLLVQAITCNVPMEKLAIIKKIRIERSFIHVFLKRFVEDDAFLHLYQRFMQEPDSRKVLASKMTPHINSVGSKTRHDYFLALTLTKANLEAFYKYFDSVLDKYYKLCYTKAMALVQANPNNNYDFKDLVQNLRRKTVIAVNKYDASSGALTSYIKWWMYNSITSSSSEHEYNIAYTIPQNLKTKMATGTHAVNFAVSMDAVIGDDDEGAESSLHNMLNAETPEMDDQAASEHMLDCLYVMAKNADPHGIARLSLDIPEVFTESELNFMRTTTLARSVNTAAR